MRKVLCGVMFVLLLLLALYANYVRLANLGDHRYQLGAVAKATTVFDQELSPMGVSLFNNPRRTRSRGFQPIPIQRRKRVIPCLGKPKPADPSCQYYEKNKMPMWHPRA